MVTGEWRVGRIPLRWVLFKRGLRADRPEAILRSRERRRGRLFSIDEGDAHSWSPGSAGDASFSPPWMRDEGGRDIDGCCATARFWACDSCRASTPTKAWTSGHPIDDVGSWRLAWT